MTTKLKNIQSKIKSSSASQVRKALASHKKNIKDIVGCLSAKDASELKEIIESTCERIDENAWKNLH